MTEITNYIDDFEMTNPGGIKGIYKADCTLHFPTRLQSNKNGNAEDFEEQGYKEDYQA